MLPSPAKAPSRASSAGGCFLIGIGIFVLFTGSLACIEARNSTPWEYEFSVERTPRGGGSSTGFSSGFSAEPLSLSIWLMVGGSLIAASHFISRKNFSLKTLMIYVLLIGALGMIPAKTVASPSARMSSRCMFNKPFSDQQIQQLKNLLEPRAALATLPETFVNELQLSPSTKLGELSINAVSDAQTFCGAEINIKFSPSLNVAQREALVEFYAYYFESLCLEAAKFNGSIDDDSSSNPHVSGRFYKYLDAWKAQRAKRLPAPEATPAR